MVQPPDFDAVYDVDRDPWRVSSSFYEQRKLDIVLASLASARYELAWDPACGTGELASRLASRCTRVLATDGSTSAVMIAKDRCSRLDNVDVRVLTMPASPRAAGSPYTAGVAADLVLISEWLYYLDAAERRETLALVRDASAQSAEVVAVHWRPRAADAWLSGDQMQAEITDHFESENWRHTVHHVDEDFRLDSFRSDASVSDSFGLDASGLNPFGRLDGGPQ